MAIKTFTTGEVLTASDTNTYLANAGLVLITSGITVSSAGGTAATLNNGTVTIGSGNTSVTLSGAFSATYDNYRIMVTGVTCSANQPNFQLTLGSAATGYSWGGFEIGYGVGTLAASATTVGTYFYIGNFGNATSMSSQVDLYRPFLSENTNCIVSAASTAWSVTNNGYLNNSTSYTAFTIKPSSGTITGGTVRVYGYRQV